MPAAVLPWSFVGMVTCRHFILCVFPCRPSDTFTSCLLLSRSSSSWRSQTHLHTRNNNRTVPRLSERESSKTKFYSSCRNRFCCNSGMFAGCLMRPVSLRHSSKEMCHPSKSFCRQSWVAIQIGINLIFDTQHDAHLPHSKYWSTYNQS